MKVHVDPTADAFYIRLNETSIDSSVPIHTEEVRPGVVLDFDAEGQVVRIEMLHISTRMRPEEMRTLHFATT